MAPESLDDSQFDWRVEDKGKVAVPHPLAGRRILQVSMMKDAQRGLTSFTTPHPSALLLNIALGASATAETLRTFLTLSPSMSPSGEPGKQYSADCLGNLYSFFEQSIVAVTMSYQALEVFCNATIGRRLKGTIRAKYRKNDEDFDAARAERILSTGYKLSHVVPDLLGVATPSGTTVWERFRELEDARDSAVHLKSVDMYTNYQTIDVQSLFFEFLSTDVRQYPAKAIAVIEHFYPAEKPRWLTGAKVIATKDSAVGQGLRG